MHNTNINTNIVQRDVETQNQQNICVKCYQLFTYDYCCNCFLNLCVIITLSAYIAAGVWCLIEISPMYKQHNVHIITPILLDIYVGVPTILISLGLCIFVMERMEELRIQLGIGPVTRPSITFTL